MARIALLASLLVAIGTLPARAQSSYSEPPLPGDEGAEWQAPPEDPDDTLDEEEDLEAEVGEDAAEDAVPGAAAGPANEEEARAFEAYLRELESRQEGSEQAPRTEIPEDTEEVPAPASAPRDVESQREVNDGFYVAQNPFFSLTMNVGANSRPGGDATVADLGLRFEGERAGLLITFGARNQTRVIGGSELSVDYGVFSLEPTFAVIAKENFRWRLRGGWSAAGNRAVSMSGISLGSSMVIHIAGPLDLEADIHLTPFPFLRAEAKVAAALHFGFVSLRMGWMGSDITDHGLGLGAGSHLRTTYSGVFLGAGLHF